jgi:putative transposase
MESAHIGAADAIQHKRAATIESFRAANRQRFTRQPALPKLPKVAWINPPDEHTTDQNGPDQEETAA